MTHRTIDADQVMPVSGSQPSGGRQSLRKPRGGSYRLVTPLSDGIPLSRRSAADDRGGLAWGGLALVGGTRDGEAQRGCLAGGRVQLAAYGVGVSGPPAKPERLRQPLP